MALKEGEIYYVLTLFDGQIKIPLFINHNKKAENEPVLTGKGVALFKNKKGFKQGLNEPAKASEGL